MRLILAAVLVAVLSGCASEGAINAAQTRISEVAVNDLRAAYESAEAFNDEAGMQCWSGLLVVAEKAGAYSTDVVGVATAYQKARNARKLVQEAGATFKDACARLYIDAPAPVRLLIDRALTARRALGVLF